MRYVLGERSGANSVYPGAAPSVRSCKPRAFVALASGAACGSGRWSAKAGIERAEIATRARVRIIGQSLAPDRRGLRRAARAESRRDVLSTSEARRAARTRLKSSAVPGRWYGAWIGAWIRRSTRRL